MPLTGERRRTYDREYKRKRRASVQIAAQAIVESVGAVARQSGGQTLVDRAAVTVGPGLIREALERSNLKLQRITDTVGAQLDAERPMMVRDGDEDGKRVTITTADNDARLRACEIGIKLHERAGTIPTGPAEQRNTIRSRMIQVSPDGSQRIVEIQTG